MMPRTRNSSVASSSLQRSYTASALAGVSSSSIPNGRRNSMWVQWYTGLRTVYGTTCAQARNLARSSEAPVMSSSSTPRARITRHL